MESSTDWPPVPTTVLRFICVRAGMREGIERRADGGAAV
jgi:hypothetical protein